MAKMGVSELKAKRLPSAEGLRALLAYAEETGHLRWRESRGRVAAGDKAGSLTNDGYITVRIGGARFLAHRLIWKIVTGDDPLPQVDHINGVRTDNRWGNLRLATQSQNFANRRSMAGRLKGAIREPRTGKWYSRVQCGGRQIHLGTFETEWAAHQAYCSASAAVFGEFARAA